jgi:hypothetical protein
MPILRTARTRAWRNTYTGYSISSAAVWAVILAIGQRRLDPDTRNALRLWCAAWWSGWTSATIARVAYPPPKKLTSRSEKRVRTVSLVLVAVGLGRVIRLLVSGKEPGAATHT